MLQLTELCLVQFSANSNLIINIWRVFWVFKIIQNTSTRNNEVTQLEMAEYCTEHKYGSRYDPLFLLIGPSVDTNARTNK